MSWNTVFTDSFTVAADTNIDQYPSIGSPDYAYNAGTGANATVNAANDRVQCTTTLASIVVRLIDAAVPTSGRYRLTFGSAGQFQATFSNGGPCVRMSAVADDAYILFWDSASALSLFRRIAGVDTRIQTLDFPETQGTVSNIFLEVEGGSGAQRLVFGANGYSRVFYDTAANRITSGAPGFYLYEDPTTNRTFVDDLTVEEWVVDPMAQFESIRHVPYV